MIRPVVPDDGSLGPVGSAVLRWLTDTAGQAVVGAAEPTTGASLAVATEPAGGDSVLLAVLALTAAVAALGVAVRTRLRVAGRWAPSGRTER